MCLYTLREFLALLSPINLSELKPDIGCPHRVHWHFCNSKIVPSVSLNIHLFYIFIFILLYYPPPECFHSKYKLLWMCLVDSVIARDISFLAKLSAFKCSLSSFYTNVTYVWKNYFQRWYKDPVFRHGLAA